MRPWLPHLVVSLVLVAELGVARLQHQTTAELQALRQSGDEQQQLDALHILASRGPVEGQETGQPRFGIPLAKELYRNGKGRLREYAFSTDVCKYEYPLWQEMMVEQRIPTSGSGPTAHWWRAYVIFKRKVGSQIVGGSLRLRLKEVRWFFDALRGIAPSTEEANEHILALQREMQGRKGK